MGQIVEWIGAVLIGTIWTLALAARVPFLRDSNNHKQSNLVWVGCVLGGLTMGMAIAFGSRTLHSPLVFVFIPACAGALFLPRAKDKPDLAGGVGSKSSQ